MRVVVEETKRRLNYLRDRGYHRLATGKWKYHGVEYGWFAFAWKRLMQREGQLEDWNPPKYYDHLDCETCNKRIETAIDELINTVLRRLVNNACSCGGRGPDDPECCNACHLWHEFQRKPNT